MTTVFLPESVSPVASDVFREQDIRSIETYAPEELNTVARILKEDDVLGIHGHVSVAFEKYPLAIGQYGVGLSSLDIPEVTHQGTAVFEAPYASGRSIAEYVLGSIYQMSIASGREVRNRTLGIVGFGNVGRQLGTLAEANDLHVLYVDKAERLSPGRMTRAESIEDLFAQSDIVSVHTDTYDISGPLLWRMPKESLFINTFSKAPIDYVALASLREQGHLAGVTLDTEWLPSSMRRLQTRGIDNVFFSPNNKAQTREAVEGIAKTVSHRLADFITEGKVTESATLPTTTLPASDRPVTRISYLHQNFNGAIAEFNHAILKRGLNILGSELATKGELAYALADVEGVLSDQDREHLSEAIASLTHHIRSRVILEKKR